MNPKQHSSQQTHPSTIPVILYFLAQVMGFVLLFLGSLKMGCTLLFFSCPVLIAVLCVQHQRELAVPAASAPVNKS